MSRAHHKAIALLRMAVLGSPEVFHDDNRLTFSLRKVQVLLLYLAVEGGLHPRSKLAAFLWPDSAPHDARTALRNAICLLRSLLADSDSTPASYSHLLIRRDTLGLDSQGPLELDLDVVQQAWQQARRLSTVPSEPQRTALVAQFQHALSLVRGPFLEGFWLREDAPFDEWVLREQQQWQVRLQLLFDRLSAWQEAAGEQEQARATLAHWLALDPLQEEAHWRLMRVQLALGDATAALQVYDTLLARLAEELRVKPSAGTVALAEHIRTTAARSPGSPPAHPSTAASEPPSELVAPLVGRAATFRQLVVPYQQARQGQPQMVLVVGEAGIGKTRLAHEFVAWARAQGAEVLSGQAFEMEGRLPYQPLVEALRLRLEEGNAPEDLLEDLWLAELSRLLPELRVRYPDLPAPTQDELTAKIRLFEAVARLLDALAQRAPLVLLLDDPQWVDGASLDLLRYLGRSWTRQGTRVLLLGTLRSDQLELNAQLSAQLADLQRDLPVTQMPLQALSRAETLQLIGAIAREEAHGTRRRGEQDLAGPGASPAQGAERPLVALGDFLFMHTGGQPFYLLETLKLLPERELLLPRLGADGTWKLELELELAAALAQEQFWRELLPPSVRSMIQARLAKLSQPVRQLVQAGAVLGTQATAQHLWQVAELGVQAGIEAVEEAVRSGMLREEEAGVGRPGRYRFPHDLVRDVVYSELGEARRLVLHQRALARLEVEGARASALVYHALLAGEAVAAYRFSMQAGMEAVAVFAVADAIGHYEQARALLQEQKRIQTELPASEVERLYAHLGRAYAFQNAWEKAQEAYEELLEYAQRQQLPTLVSMTLNRLAVLAAELRLPGERWQIQAALSRLYEAEGLPAQARTAFAEAATIIQGLAEGIKDEPLRLRFLAGPQIQPVLQQRPIPRQLGPKRSHGAERVLQAAEPAEA